MQRDVKNYNKDEYQINGRRRATFGIDHWRKDTFVATENND